LISTTIDRQLHRSRRKRMRRRRSTKALPSQCKRRPLSPFKLRLTSQFKRRLPFCRPLRWLSRLRRRTTCCSSQFGEDSIFYCTAADKSPRYLAVSEDQVLELVRQDRIGGFCNIVAKVDLVDIATMTFTLRDVTFERRTAGALPHKIFVTDLDVRDKIVARVTAAVKAARKRQRQASRSTSVAPKE
jgi:hypothetical protein